MGGLAGGLKEHEAELNHFKYVVALEVARILSDGRPEASKFGKFLPAHHKHQNSGKKIVPATSFIVKPYPYQETKGSLQN